MVVTGVLGSWSYCADSQEAESRAEKEMDIHKEQIKVINRRLEELEEKK